MTKLVLWCPPTGGPATGAPVAYWSQFLDSGRCTCGVCVSLPALVRAGIPRWKGEYLAWLESMAGCEDDPDSRVRRLAIEPGLSAWWMALPSEYAFTPTSVGYACMRIWAFAELATQMGATAIHSVGAPALVEETLRVWCSGRGWGFTSEHPSGPEADRTQVSLSHRMAARLPQGLLAVAAVAREYARHCTVRRPRVFNGLDDQRPIIIVDYYAHLDAARAAEGIFDSSYWRSLTDVLDGDSRSVCWLHIDLSEGNRSRLRASRNSLDALNSASTRSRHALLQDLMTMRVAFRAIRLCIRIQHLQEVAFVPGSWIHQESGIDCTRLVSSAWSAHLSGTGAARTAIWLAIFDGLAESVPSSSLGLFLMENQPWELALARAWHARGHEPLVGAVHSVAHVCDLRYAIGGAADRTTRTSLPAADFIATIGADSRTVLERNGYAPDRIIDVEALRYLNRGDMTVTSGRREGVVRVLMLGEYDDQLALQQRALLAEAVEMSPPNVEFRLRPHPTMGVLPFELPPGVGLSTEFAIADDLAAADAVIATNSSFASLDAFLAGLPIAMFRDGRILDRSPLPDDAPVSLVSSGRDIANWVTALDGSERVPAHSASHLLNRDPALPGWRRLIGQGPA